jgi:hypothetical protein
LTCPSPFCGVREPARAKAHGVSNIQSRQPHMGKQLTGQYFKHNNRAFSSGADGLLLNIQSPRSHAPDLLGLLRCRVGLRINQARSGFSREGVGIPILDFSVVSLLAASTMQLVSNEAWRTQPLCRRQRLKPARELHSQA